MAVHTLKSTRPIIFIPTDSRAFVKIQIIADDDTVYTVMDTYNGSTASNHTLRASITRERTEKLSSFTLTIANDGGRFLKKFDGGETIIFYSDVVDATTVIFRASIDNIKYGLNLTDGFHININGRDYPRMIDTSITGIETASGGDVSIAGILYNFYDDVTLQFWNGSSWSTATYSSALDSVSWSPTISNFPTGLINMTYQHRKGIRVIGEICKKLGLDCYMEYNSGWKLRIFKSGDITNIGANVAYGTNLKSISDYGTDNTEIINRAIVYGKTESDNILLLKTENDTTSQADKWIKDRVYNEGALSSMDEVQSKANYELAQGIITTAGGPITSMFLPSLRPGEQIDMNVPYCNLFGTHTVESFTHNFGDVFTTSIEPSKRNKTFSDVFVEKTDSDSFIGSITNPNNMTNSYTIYFNESPSIMTHSGTEETDGKLRLQSTATSGIATAVKYEADNNITECELRRYENFETSTDTYEVSNDNGISWESYTEIAEGVAHTFASIGKNLQVRLTLKRTAVGDVSPSYESICLLYK